MGFRVFGFGVGFCVQGVWIWLKVLGFGLGFGV